MITLSKTENCNYIEIKSESLSDFISNPNNYTKFTLTGKLNCCDSEEVTATIEENDLGDNVWQLQFPTNGSADITGLFFENIYTGQQFNALSSILSVGDYMCSTGDITALFTLIQDWFTLNFGITVTQNYTYDAGTNTCTYTIIDLPVNIRPVKLVTELSGVSNDVYFTYFPIEGVFFTGTSLLVTPSFFNLTEFVDGIYSFTLTYYSDESIITETTCFFFDCKTACQVSTKLEQLFSKEKTATNIFLLHYTLTEGSNCGCNCAELCEIFTKLCAELGDLTCSSCNCN